MSSEPEIEGLISEVYDHLRGLAARYQRQRPQDSIQPTVLVHEAWLRLSGWEGRFESEGHFKAVAAKAMRQILLDRARRRMADKRGGGALVRTTISGLQTEDAPVDLIDLDAALSELEELDALGARIVEMRYLGGLSVTETAEVLGMSRSAVQKSWRLSRAWLESRMSG